MYERYLAKKAKKLGISVEELKAQGASPVTSAPVEEKPAQQEQQISEPQYIQHTIQEHLENQPYSGMRLKRLRQKFHHMFLARQECRKIKVTAVCLYSSLQELK